MLRFKSLASGSSGNATLVEASQGAHTTRLLIDCGIQVKELCARLEQAGTALEELDAIFITHEHGDHVGCAKSLLKRKQLPVWMSQGTRQALHDAHWTAYEPWLRVARDHHTVDLNALQITPFTVPHDAREPLQLRCSDGQRELGVVTDLGHVTPHVRNSLAACHALLLEANHDPDLLQRSAYPAFLKTRVSGDWGHLSNAASAELLSQLKHPGLTHVVAAHLSERNNTPELARSHLSAALGCLPQEIEVAHPSQGTPWIRV